MSTCYTLTTIVLVLLSTTPLPVVADRATGPISEFHFLRKDCIGGAVFSDVSGRNDFGGMVRDVSRTSCLNGNGIRAVPDAMQGKSALSSVNNIREILKYFRGSEVSFEFWIRTKDSLLSQTSLMAVGVKDTISSYSVRLDQRADSSIVKPSGLYLRAKNNVDAVVALDSNRLRSNAYAHAVFDLRYLSPMFLGKPFYNILENVTINATKPQVCHCLD